MSKPLVTAPSIESIPHVAFNRGMTVLLKAGAEVKTTNGAKKHYQLKRTQQVKVADVMRGTWVSVNQALSEFKDELLQQGFDLSQLAQWQAQNSMEYYKTMVQIYPPEITWVGAGGYWHRTAIENISAVTK